jgi:tetratricopeptide (TPR) repeat protein
MLSVRFGWLVVFATLFAALCSSSADAQSAARDRQAAAEAYDQGTTAYVAQDYEKAAQWFETANRMSPAAPALIQAARAHQQAGHLARAATLALALVQTYPDDATANEFGEGVLNDLGPKFVRVDVECTDCALDVDGTLEETHSFFVEPDDEHNVTASFDTGERKETISGSAGESKSLTFEAPPQKPKPVIDGSEGTQPIIGGEEPKPLSPVFTYVGIGLSAALLIGSIASTLDVYSGVDDYESAAKEWHTKCDGLPDTGTCKTMHTDATDKLNDGESKQTRTTVLWVATGAVAAATTIVALALTNWSGEGDEQEHAETARLRLGFGADDKGAALTLKGSF